MWGCGCGHDEVVAVTQGVGRVLEGLARLRVLQLTWGNLRRLFEW